MEWLIEGLIPKSAVTLLSGESGCGKSTLALGLAGAVVHGRDFLGLKTDQRNVLIVDGENGASIYHDRLRRLCVERTPLLHVWGVWCDKHPIGPKEPAIARFVKEKQPLIIFDSLIAFHPGSEQDASETRRYLDDFRKLAADGATVILLHHTGKSLGSREYRGSSDIKASVDTAYLLESKGALLQSLTLTPYKSREGEVKPIDITLRDGHFELRGDYDREAIRAIIRENPKINQSEIVSEAQGIPAHKVRAILGTGERDGWLGVTRGPKNAQRYTLMEAG